jgi:pilus assembly protein CpaB
MTLSGRSSLYLALALAVLAGLLAYMGLYGREARLDKKWEPQVVAVAARPIKQGQILQLEDLKAAEVPRRFLPGSAVSISEVEDQHLLGQRATIDFNTDDLILTNFIQPASGAGGGFSDTIQKKARAVSIRVSPESSANNMVRPGDRVDVLATFRDPNGTENLTTTLLENVWVLGTGTLTGRDSFVPQSQRNFTTVTLQVLPEAAELLVLSQTLGTLYLTLRNPEDDEISDAGRIASTMKTIISGERAKILSKQQKQVFQSTKIEIIKGTKSTDVSFPDRKK